MPGKEPPRFVYRRDPDLTVTGFATYGEAKAVADKIPETDERRIRVRMRSRTGTWDVVVKTRQQVTGENSPRAIGRIDEGR